MAHYKITNTTKHPGVKKGPHKNGLFVAVVEGRLMGPNRHILVEKVTPGMLAMQRKGYISISEVKDINIEVQKEVEHVEKQNEKKRREREKNLTSQAKLKASDRKKQELEDIAEACRLKEESVVDSSLDKGALKELVKNSQNEGIGKAIVSGEGNDPLGDVEKAISPDGAEPNFVVKAGRQRNKGKNKK